MLVDVTQSIIDAARAANTCPITLAIKQQTGQDYIVASTNYLPPGSKEPVDLPPIAIRWLAMADLKLPVEPMLFKI